MEDFKLPDLRGRPIPEIRQMGPGVIIPAASVFVSEETHAALVASGTDLSDREAVMTWLSNYWIKALSEG